MHVNGLAKPGTESRAIIITTAMHSYMQAENKMINDPIVKLSSSQFHVHMYVMYIRGIPANKERSYGNFLVHFESCNDNRAGPESVSIVQTSIPELNFFFRCGHETLGGGES